MEPAKWSMHSSSNFLFSTSAASWFAGLLAGHLVGKNIQCLHRLQRLEEPQRALVVLFIHFPNGLTPVQGHTELQAHPSMHWVEGRDIAPVFHMENFFFLLQDELCLACQRTYSVCSQSHFKELLAYVEIVSLLFWFLFVTHVVQWDYQQRDQSFL